MSFNSKSFALSAYLNMRAQGEVSPRIANPNVCAYYDRPPLLEKVGIMTDIPSPSTPPSKGFLVSLPYGMKKPQRSLAEIKEDAEYPGDYKVILWGNEDTSVGIMARALERHFKKAAGEARELAELAASRTNTRVGTHIGTYSHEVAEARMADALALARKQDYRLLNLTLERA